MKFKYTVSIIILILILFLSPPALAFSETWANSWQGATYGAGTTTPEGWNVFTGDWSQGTVDNYGNITDNYYLKSSSIDPNPATINYSVGGSNYFSVDIKPFPSGVSGCGGGYTCESIFIFQSNATSSYNIRFWINSATGAAAFKSNLPGWVEFDVTGKGNVWYRITGTITGSQISVKIVSEQNPNFNNTQVRAITPIQGSDKIQIKAQGNGHVSYYDNIVVSTTPPSAANTITWGSTSYVKDDSGSYTWAISDGNWASWSNQYKVFLYKNDELINIQTSFPYDNIPLSTQTGTQYYTFPDIGIYDIRVYSCPFGVCTVGTKIANNTINVRTTGAPYIHTANKVPVLTPLNVDFIWGRTPTYPLISGIRYWHLDDDGVYRQEGIKRISAITGSLSTNLVATTQYSTNISVAREGIYKIELFDFMYGILATTSTEAEAVYLPPNSTLTNSYLTLLNNSFMMGEMLSGSYGVDGTNYSIAFSGDKTLYLEFYNWDYNTVTSSQPIVSQQSPFSGFLVQTVGSYPNQINILQGNNKVQLVLRNATNTTEIIFYNFTVSSKDSEGYGLLLSKLNVCIGESFNLLINSPLPTNLTIKNSKYTIVKQFKINATYGINVPIILTIADTYDIILTKPDGTEIVRYIKVKNCAVATPIATATPTAPTGDKAVSSLGDNLRTFMAMPAFWGLFITIFAFYLIGKTVPNAVGFGMIILLNIEGIIGLWAPYTAYILAVTWIFAGIYFSLGQKTLKG